MKPKFVITSQPQRTILELVLEPEAEAKAELEPVLDFAALESSATLFYLRYRMQVMWEKYCFAILPEASPIPPLPPVRWIHQ